MCYIASMRAGRTKTTSFSLDDETLKNLRAMAARRHGGNVSALITHLAAQEIRLAAAEAYFEKYGIAALDAAQTAEIEAEWRAALLARPQPSKKRRVA